jgi:hypothetical protein
MVSHRARTDIASRTKIEFLYVVSACSLFENVLASFKLRIQAHDLPVGIAPECDMLHALQSLDAKRRCHAVMTM